MVKFATRIARAIARAQIKTIGVGPDTLTFEGGAGFTRDAKSELFLLAVTNMVGEADVLRGGHGSRRSLSGARREGGSRGPGLDRGVRAVPARQDADAFRIGRDGGRVRSCAAGFGEGRGRAPARCRGRASGPTSPTIRSVVASALSRADEPAEMIAYWQTRNGRGLPKPVKRGVADAVTRLYNERAALKYDGETRGYRMADVLELAHAGPIDARQSALFRYLIDKRHNRDVIEIDPANLPVIAARRELDAVPQAERRALLTTDGFRDRLGAAGATWEWLSGWLNGPMDAAAWEAVIPSMGYMAMLRNLRNFEEAKVSAETRARGRSPGSPTRTRSRRAVSSRCGSTAPSRTPGRWRTRRRWSRLSTCRWPTCRRSGARR